MFVVGYELVKVRVCVTGRLSVGEEQKKVEQQFLVEDDEEGGGEDGWAGRVADCRDVACDDGCRGKVEIAFLGVVKIEFGAAVDIYVAEHAGRGSGT
jgi:hypothetical protein